MKYDLLIIGAGPGGIFSAYEAMKLNPELKIGLFESGTSWKNVNVQSMVIRSNPV